MKKWLIFVSLILLISVVSSQNYLTDISIAENCEQEQIPSGKFLDSNGKKLQLCLIKNPVHSEDKFIKEIYMSGKDSCDNNEKKGEIDLGDNKLFLCVKTEIANEELEELETVTAYDATISNKSCERLYLETETFSNSGEQYILCVSYLKLELTEKNDSISINSIFSSTGIIIILIVITLLVIILLMILLYFIIAHGEKKDKHPDKIMEGSLEKESNKTNLKENQNIDKKGSKD